MDNNLTTWVKARRCDSGLCVEVASVGDEILIRNSNVPGEVTGLAFTRQEWEAFAEGVKAGDFNQI